MMRTTVGLLASSFLFVLAVPVAVSESIAIGGNVGTEGAPTVDADGFPSVPEADLPLQGLMPSDEDRFAQPETATDSDPEPGEAKQTTITGLAPEAEKAAAVAGAGAGLALLVGLVAHALGIPLFSRIQSNRMLDNGVRQRVHDTIVANPGITIKEVVGVCGIGWGTAVYHLKRLESERLVVSERNRQFRRYFKNGGGIVNDSKTAFGELKNPTTERLAQSILREPGRCQKELCETVGISAPLAHKFLSRLADAGLISSQREWKTVKYFPTPKLEDLLQPAKLVQVALSPTSTAVAA